MDKFGRNALPCGCKYGSHKRMQMSSARPCMQKQSAQSCMQRRRAHPCMQLRSAHPWLFHLMDNFRLSSVSSFLPSLIRWFSRWTFSTRAVMLEQVIHREFDITSIRKLLIEDRESFAMVRISMLDESLVNALSLTQWFNRMKCLRVLDVSTSDSSKEETRRWRTQILQS